jgi:hypothetical protein
MTNFVAALHGWHSGAALEPLPHLQFEMSSDQFELLNPTARARDVQLGAIIDQCTGDAAKK